MEHLLRSISMKLLLVAFVGGLYFLGFTILKSKDVSLLPRLEARPHHVEWVLSEELATPEDVVNFVNARGLHSFQIITDVHQGGWHFHVVYE